MSSESATLVGIFFSSFGIGLATSAVPGPIVVSLVERAMETGFSAAMLFLAGMLAVDAFVLAAAIMGFAGLFGTPLFTVVSGLLGGAFLIWTGLSVLRRSRTYSVRAEVISAGEKTSARGRAIHPTLAGLSITISSPLYWVWWATVGLGYISWTVSIGHAALITFIAGLMAGFALFHVVLAFLVARGRRFFPDKLYRTVILVSGGVLAAFGVYFVFVGMQNLSSF